MVLKNPGNGRLNNLNDPDRPQCVKDQNVYSLPTRVHPNFIEELTDLYPSLSIIGLIKSMITRARNAAIFWFTNRIHNTKYI